QVVAGTKTADAIHEQITRELFGQTDSHHVHVVMRDCCLTRDVAQVYAMTSDVPDPVTVDANVRVVAWRACRDIGDDAKRKLPGHAVHVYFVIVNLYDSNALPHRDSRCERPQVWVICWFRKI